MEVTKGPSAGAGIGADPLFDISGQRILLAGGAGGLGSPLAHLLAERGARLLLADLDLEGAEEVARDLRALGATADVCQLDVTREDSCARVVGTACERLGGLDALVNATGVYRIGPALDIDRRDWDLTLDANLTGAFLLARAAGRHMVAEGRGRIVTLASVSSVVVNPDYVAYASSKAGVAHLTRILALEWARAGVNVNAIGPAVIPTALSRPITEDEERRAGALAKIPVGRFGTPQDLAGAVILLLSPAGDFITGQTLYVDGGRTLL